MVVCEIHTEIDRVLYYIHEPANKPFHSTRSNDSINNLIHGQKWLLLPVPVIPNTLIVLLSDLSDTEMSR